MCVSIMLPDRYSVFSCQCSLLWRGVICNFCSYGQAYFGYNYKLCQPLWAVHTNTVEQACMAGIMKAINISH